MYEQFLQLCLRMLCSRNAFGEKAQKNNVTFTLKTVYLLEDSFYKLTSNVSLLSKSFDCFVPF